MNTTIWKFDTGFPNTKRLNKDHTLPIEITVPKDSRPFYADWQSDSIKVWCIVPNKTEKDTEVLQIVILGTGWSIDQVVGSKLSGLEHTHLNTLIDSYGFVWHVFELHDDF